MIDLDRQFEQAWAGEPLLPDPGTHLAAGKRRLRRRRVVTTTLGSVAVVAVVAGGTALVGGGTPRSAEPDFTSHSTSPPAAPKASLDDQYEVRAWPDPDVPALPLSYDDHAVYRTDDSVHVEQRDGLIVRDAVTGANVGDETFLQTTWKGKTDITYFDQVNGTILESGSVPGDWQAVLDEADLRPTYYHHFPGGFELFTDPVGLDPASGAFTAKTGATIESERTAAAGEYSTKRFDSGPPHVGVVQIAGAKYYAIAGYRSGAKDVIWSEQADGRTLDEFLAEIKQRMDDGSLAG